MYYFKINQFLRYLNERSYTILTEKYRNTEYRNTGNFIAIFEKKKKHRNGKWLGEAQQFVNEIYHREQ